MVADSGGRQALRLHALTDAQAREDSAAGILVLEGRTGETATADGTWLWAGRTARGRDAAAAARCPALARASGLLLTAVVFFVLALGTGSAATGLLILGPISTFGLAGVAVIAFWWNDWPGSRLGAPWTGVVDTLLVAAIAMVLTIAGQAVIERPGIGAVFEATPGPAAPTTSPATMAQAGATFTAMLQLSLVCERWPLGRFGRFWSGIAALVLS